MVAKEKDLSASFPEIVLNQKRIQLVKETQRRQLLHASDGNWGQGRPGYKQHLFGWKASGFLDVGLEGNELARQDVERKMASFGGRDHAKCVGRLIHEAATRSSGFDPSPRKANDSEDLDRRFYKDPENRRARASTSLELYKQHRERDLPKTWAASVSRSPLRQDPSESVGTRRLKVKKPKREEDGLEVEERDIRLERMLAGVSSPASPMMSPKQRQRPRIKVPFGKTPPHSTMHLARQPHDARFLGDDNGSRPGTFGQESEASGQQTLMRPATDGSGPGTQGEHQDDSDDEEAGVMSRPTRGYGDERGGAFSPMLATRALHAPHLSPLAAIGGGRISNIDIAHIVDGGRKTVAARDTANSLVAAHAQEGERGWGADVMALRAAAGKGQKAIQKLKLASPLTGLERNVLSMSPWRQAAADMDAHDQAVVSGMPYHAHASVKAEGSLRSLGNVVHSKDAQVRIAALAAIGDKSNFGDPTCLAHIVPLLTDPDPAVKAAALRAVEQVAEPGQSRSYMEIELEVFGATNLPKKDRFGACDGYVTVELRNERTGVVQHSGRTAIVWRELNPRWKKTFFWEVRCPEEEEIEFAVWDEDGESDDLVGRCMLPVTMIEFDESNSDRPQLSKSMQLLAEDRETPILGYNDLSFENDGKPSKLQIRAKYAAYLRPKDLMEAFVSLLNHESAQTRAAALKTVASFGLKGDVVVRDAIISMLRDPDHSIRMVAMRTLEDFAERNDAETIETVAALMEHEEEPVRLVAVEALGRITDKGHRVAVREVLQRMQSHRSEVQQLVPDAITVVADVSDSRARLFLIDALEDERADVRECALLTLLKLSSPGDVQLLEQVSRMLDDASHLCRWAAVNVIFRIGSVKPEDDQQAKSRAEELLQHRLTMKHGIGDPSPMVRQAAERRLEQLQKALPMTFVTNATPIGQYSATLPAGYVAYSKEKGVYSYLVDPMPVDTKFHSTLPYRPPTPPWEPAAQAKAQLKESMGKARKQLNVLQINIDDMVAEEASREASGHTLTVSEGMELDEKRRQAQALEQQIAKWSAELEEIGGKPEVQPSNTTKLGFTVDRVTRKGDHCQKFDCMRSGYY